mmetsp:Transcript_23963/g.53935  ORF Transcript_23963/g.53935 Transcript_23963/m.53935 type:complete len:390 (-) Transcript_23963:7-1176(-)
MAALARVSVLNLAGRQLAVVDGDATTTVREVKDAVAANGGPGWPLQRLTWEARALEDAETFGDLAWSGEITVHMITKDLDVDGLLQKLAENASPAAAASAPRWNPCPKDIEKLCEVAADVFMAESPILHVSPPVVVCGSISGYFFQLMRVFEKFGNPSQAKYVFLGNYVDRGPQSIETIMTLLLYKCQYPSRVILLRGKHECLSINRIYGFYDEVRRRYTPKLWKRFQDVWNVMPFCALVQNRILCVSSGLSLDLQTRGSLEKIQRIVRPTDVPDFGVLYDLIWGEPRSDVKGFPDDPRAGPCFGPDVVEPFLQEHGLDMICRTGLVEDGHEFFAGTRLVTIVSHVVDEFANAATVMTLDEDLKPSFVMMDERGGVGPDQNAAVETRAP